MIKKGISFILFCLYGILSYAQEDFSTIKSQPYTSEGGISIWVIIACIVASGTIMYFIGMYVNSRKQKAEQQPAPQSQVLPTKEASQPLPSNETTPLVQPVENIGQIVISPSEKAVLEEELQASIDISTSEESEGIMPPMPDKIYKLLVIEDHKDIRLYLKILFNKDYKLLMAENGEDGLKMARKELPDIIITDVMMPMMNGFECCKRIKEDLKTCHIPVIVLTALTGDENIVKGIELGADDYISKPFNPEVLKAKVKRLIKSRQELKHIYTRLLTPKTNIIESKIEENEEIGEEKPEDPFITQIVEIVENNLQTPDFSVKKLAEMLNMSQPTLYRRVKLLTNFTIIELVRGIRLKRSAELLRSRQYNVQEVAEMVGYNDIPTFRKHFIDFYGTTPSTYGRDE